MRVVNGINKMNKNKIDALSHGILLLAWIIGLIIIAASADAQSIKIRVLAMTGEHGFNCDETLEYYKMAAYLIESQPAIRIRHKFRCIENQNTLALNRTFATFRGLDNHYKKRRIPLKIISNPIVWNNQIYTGGLAFIGLNAGLGWSFVAPMNQNKEDRTLWALITIAHELAHILGAEHDESEGSIMSTVALGRLKENPNQTLAFTPESIRQIRREIRFYKRKIKQRRKTKHCVLA